MMDASKYAVGYYPAPGKHLKWVERDHIKKAPQWCSVDLRDGNQSLVIPMSLEEKLEFYKLLVKVGFKEIEVGFPASSDTEYNFIRALIEKNMIPEDVTIQVLTQASPTRWCTFTIPPPWSRGSRSSKRIRTP